MARPPATLNLKGGGSQEAEWKAMSSARSVTFYRQAIALLAGCYFARLAWEVPAFHSNTGLLDHQWAEVTFPYLWQPLFRPYQSDFSMRFLLAAASGLCLPLALGVYPRLCAGILYFVLCCSYRWNFLVATVDDELLHLSLFWLQVLLQHPEGPGRRLLAWNFSLLYVVAGFSKWTSPMWRSGTALAAVMQLPGSRFPEALAGLDLRPLSWLALLLEPLFALLPWLPAGRGRRLLMVLWLGFHGLLVLTFDVAIANLCCLAAGLVIFELPCDGRWTRVDRLAGLVLALLVGSQLGSFFQPSWRSGTTSVGEAGSGLQRGCNAALWCLGLAQQYRLLDWIDERNYQADLQTLEGDQSWPIPGHLRQGLALSYLTPAPWLCPPAEQRERLRQSSWRRWRQWCGRPVQLHWRRL